jgi:hypothetical protein
MLPDWVRCKTAGSSMSSLGQAQTFPGNFIRGIFVAAGDD